MAEKEQGREMRMARLNLAEAIRRHLILLGGVDLTLLARQSVRRPPKILSLAHEGDKSAS